MDLVLLTSIGSASAGFAINSLKKIGCRVIGTDINDACLLYNASLVDEFYLVPPSYNEIQYVDSLLIICKKERIKYLIVLTDLEVDVLSKYHSFFSEEGITLCIEKDEVIRLLRNKWLWNRALKNFSKLQIIPTFNSYSQYLSDYSVFPLVAKPASGRSSEGFFRINNENEVSESIKYSKDYIFQPFLEGKIVVVDALFHQGRKVAAIARREWIRTKNGMGVSVEVFFDRILEESVFEFFKNIDFKGVLNLEFIETEKGYYLMDINPRFSAGIAFSGLAGYDFVLNHLAVFQDRNPHILSQYPPFFAVKTMSEKVTLNNSGIAL